MTEGPQCLPAVPGDSGSCPRAHRFYQLSRATLLGPLRKVPQGQPAVSCDLGPSLRARGVNQQSRGNRACAGGPAVSRSCPG